MRVLSFDQASAKTGWAVFDGDALVDCGLIDLSYDKNTESRIKKMALAIHKLITDAGPDIVVAEGVQMQSSPKVFAVLARIQGCIMQSCFIQGCKYLTYAPSTWRKKLRFRIGSGTPRGALKQQAIDFVHEIFKMDIEEDVCEAICIGVAYAVEKDIITNFARFYMDDEEEQE